MKESREEFEKRARAIASIISKLKAGCSQYEFFQLRCPVCGDGLSLSVNPNRRILYVRCKKYSMHVGVHDEVDHWVDWWANFISDGWCSDTPDKL